MCIERAFGLLKRRFPALKFEIRLRKPVDICNMIVAACILHNLCTWREDCLDQISSLSLEEHQPDDAEGEPGQQAQPGRHAAGIHIRNVMVQECADK